jgi:hypothetical protein
LVAVPVLGEDRDESHDLFKHGPDGKLVKMQTQQIKRATTTARGSPAWTPNVSQKLTYASWKTIYYREAVGSVVYAHGPKGRLEWRADGA